MYWLIAILIVVILLTYWYLLIPIVAVFLAWKIYEALYYNSKSFSSIRERIQAYINDCNALNRHIEELKKTPLGEAQRDYGNATYKDASKWKFKRPELNTVKYSPNIYNCSRTVCDNARKKPFDYLCKYFGFKATEETLEIVENALNNFEAAENGKIALKEERESILLSIQNDIPWLIKKFSKKKLEQRLGFDEVDFGTAYFPKFIFKYVSSGGNASTQCDIIMDIDNLNKFVVYLSEKIKFKKSAAGQRALMTSKLRQFIKERDDYTCKKCGNSVKQEPNLLLEIDHIVPIARGGITTEENLQTLCWKCNRSKGAKIE